MSGVSLLNYSVHIIIDNFLHLGAIIMGVVSRPAAPLIVLILDFCYRSKVLTGSHQTSKKVSGVKYQVLTQKSY